MDTTVFRRLFHHVQIACSCDRDVATALDARLGRFPLAEPGQDDLVFDYRRVGPGGSHQVEPISGPTRSIYNSAIGEVLYSDAEDRIYLTVGDRVRVACDPRRGHTRISIVDFGDEHLWLSTHPLFTLPLIESLKRRGRYSLHAAGVAIGGKAILFPGTSGAGKSTLALAMVREGFGFLGDDMLFLAHGKDGLRALAFPESVDLTDDTIRLFPDLEKLLEQPKPPGWPKRQLRAEERYSAAIAWDCQPVALVFPRVARGGRSVLEPMDPGEALLELAPNILLTESRSSQAHLDALGELVRACRCYRLETGSDFKDVAARLRALVEVEG